jgi:hypothetical protein
MFPQIKFICDVHWRTLSLSKSKIIIKVLFLLHIPMIHKVYLFSVFSLRSMMAGLFWNIIPT